MADDRPPGYDDWFDEPQPPAPVRGARPSYDAVEEEPEDVWVIPEDAPRRRRSRSGSGDIVIGGRALTTTQVAIIAAAALAVFIAILAAAGVFNSSAKSNPLTISSNTLPTTTGSTVPNVTVTPPTVQLKPGDTGHQVKLLQRALATLGYSPGKADGSYGPGTKAALQLFQSATPGLTQDGVLGPKTLAALRHALLALGG